LRFTRVLRLHPIQLGLGIPHCRVIAVDKLHCILVCDRVSLQSIQLPDRLLHIVSDNACFVQRSEMTDPLSLSLSLSLSHAVYMGNKWAFPCPLVVVRPAIRSMIVMPRMIQSPNMLQESPKSSEIYVCDPQRCQDVVVKPIHIDAT
jgi:hypothetical protein